MSDTKSKINALKIELYDILEQQAFLQRRNEVLESMKQDKLKALNEERALEEQEQQNPKTT